jgi:hypothetical protein
MRHVNTGFVALLCSAALGAGCATTHLSGTYDPNSRIPLDKAHELGDEQDMKTLATGHDWVLAWGLVELQSTDMAEKVKGQLRNDEILKDVQVRNHVSLGGALLWIVSLGTVSHHDVDLRGRVVNVKEIPPAAPTERGPTPGTSAMALPPESEIFAENVVDRPIGDVSRDFNDAASKAGLATLASVKWDELTPAERSEYRGEIPENKLEAIAPSKVQSFCVANEAFANDVKSDPKCGTHLPCLVFYEADGKTRSIYARPTTKLKMFESAGGVDGKRMSRAEFDRHFAMAQDFEKSCDKLLANLKTTP